MRTIFEPPRNIEAKIYNATLSVAGTTIQTYTLRPGVGQQFELLYAVLVNLSVGTRSGGNICRSKVNLVTTTGTTALAIDDNVAGSGDTTISISPYKPIFLSYSNYLTFTSVFTIDTDTETVEINACVRLL